MVRLPPSIGTVLRRPGRSHGVGAILLTLVVAFALVAIIELTRSWFNARHISDDLGPIRANAYAIAHDTRQASRLFQTSQLTDEINRQTQPLEYEAGHVQGSAADIAAKAQHVRSSAASIEGGVRAVDATATDINATVLSLLGTVRSITGHATTIGKNAAAIEGSFASLRPVIDQIHDGPMPYGIQNTDRNADRAIRVVAGIKSDLGNVLTIVNEVDQQATSICRAPLIHAC